MKSCFWLIVACASLAAGAEEIPEGPLRFGMVGLTHDHARGFLPGALSRRDIRLVGIAEANEGLARRYAREYNLDTNLLFGSLRELLERTKPEAVGVFTSTFEHREIVETCAAHRVHVMMEKPLAVSMDHARAIQSFAEKAGIHVVVNFETTWYPANHAAYEWVHGKRAIGELRKIVVHDGHQGPKEIGCSREFLEWLTDPVLNGGGALTDFGCYGANLITWLMKGQRPASVFAVTQQIKPDVYPRVDDEATIVLTYPGAQGIIQASWNWPFNRKDMEIYGRTGYAHVPEQNLLRVRTAGTDEVETVVSPLPAPNGDPLSWLAALVRGRIRPEGMSSLEINLVATEILDAARESARTGKSVTLPRAAR